MKYFTTPHRHILDFKGRSSRREYWIFLLWMLLPVLVATVMFALVGFVAIFNDAPEPFLPYGTIYGICLPLFILACILPLPALAVRQLHDSDRSGWWFFVPMLGVLLIAFAPGTDGANRYG